MLGVQGMVKGDQSYANDQRFMLKSGSKNVSCAPSQTVSTRILNVVKANYC
jgi:hypothetical protein